MNHVVLVHPAIPQNTGNIMRTCAATHTPLHIIKPTGFKLNDPRMKRAVMDYFDHLTFKVYENFEEFEKENPGIYHFFTRYSKLWYTDQNYVSDQDQYILFGHEHDGIPHDILKDHLDECVRIAMDGNARSLYLSNCVAIGIYEVLRQQNYPKLSKVEVQKGADFIYEE